MAADLAVPADDTVVPRPRHAGRLPVLCLALVMLFPGCAGPTADGPVPEPRSSAAGNATSPGLYAAALLDATNAARVSVDLAALQASGCAAEAAGARASLLVGAPSLSHAPLAEVIAGCPPAVSAAENLSRASADPSEVVAAWMGSPGHRANIVDPDLVQLGAECVPDGADLLCSVVFLGR